MTAWLSFVVAAIALVQVWVIAFWRRFFRRATLDVHETGTIEVGYSLFGPTLALNGTLRAVHGDVFVRDIHLVLTRLRDQSQHVFDLGRFPWSVTRDGYMARFRGTRGLGSLVRVVWRQAPLLPWLRP